jgi:hypothetical protein
VHAVGEEVREALAREGALAERLVVALPGRQKARDRRRRQTCRGLLAEQRTERLLEVARREAAQVQQTFGERRMYGGRIALVKRWRLPFSSTRRSRTRGACTLIVPVPVVT